MKNASIKFFLSILITASLLLIGMNFSLMAVTPEEQVVIIEAKNLFKILRAEREKCHKAYAEKVRCYKAWSAWEKINLAFDQLKVAANKIKKETVSKKLTKEQKDVIEYARALVSFRSKKPSEESKQKKYRQKEEKIFMNLRAALKLLEKAEAK